MLSLFGLGCGCSCVHRHHLCINNVHSHDSLYSRNPTYARTRSTFSGSSSSSTTTTSSTTTSSSSNSHASIVNVRPQLMMWRTGYKIFWLQTIFLLFNILTSTPVSSYEFHTSDTWTNARVILTYEHPVTKNRTIEDHEDYGRFDTGPVSNAQGVVIHGKVATGCMPYLRKKIPPKQSWIALVKRGNCAEWQKIAFADALNASAVVIYNDQPGTELTTISNSGHIPIILISAQDGGHLAALVDNRTRVFMEIGIGNKIIQRIHVKKSSVLFVSVSFIVLMTISLAWLVFYYIQRFRYAQARGRTQKRLGRAAKKAITKLPSRTLRDGDEELEDEFCPICLEMYTSLDCIRILPCKHFYHKSCVDQWLVEHRTCPMCKLNILKALGYQQHVSICPTEEGPLYVFDIGQMIFNSTTDHDIIDHEANRPREVHVDTVRSLLNPRQMPLSDRGVRVVVVTEDTRSESSGSDGSRNGSSSSEGILPPVTTTVEMHETGHRPVPLIGPTTV